MVVVFQRMLERMMVAVLVLASAPASGEPLLQADAVRLVGADQGVYARAADGTVLAEVVADRPVHPASVSKVATTLALLQRLGPEHRFETRLWAGGPIDARGVLGGDLVVEAGGDPFLVYESAFLMLDALGEQGVRRVAGRVACSGPLFFNWKPDPAGRGLERALAGRDGAGAWASARSLDAGVEAASLAAAALPFGAEPGGALPGGAPLVVYRSPTLRAITKALNCYSNNVFHPLADRIGGPAEVERVARATVPPEQQGEIVLQNGAGAGTVNRLSPRAVVAIMDALGRELARHHLDLVDVLPVSGIDPGTLRVRLDGPGERGVVVGKTGTYGSVGACALAGVVSTERFGRVTFAVLNRGVDVPEARRRQDAFVRAILAAGGAKPLDYPSPAPSPLTEIEVREAGAAARR